MSMTSSAVVSMDDVDLDNNTVFNKQIPEVLYQSVIHALSFYPELKTTSIDFRIVPNINGSVMQAQPDFGSLLKRRGNRKYRIKISTNFKLTNSNIPIEQLPSDVIVGWIGHELGHIMDYESRSNLGLVSFGLQYYFFPSYLKRAEAVADTFAVTHGLGKYIVTTKRFILDHADLPQSYKDKIARLYLSPDEVMDQLSKS